MTFPSDQQKCGTCSKYQASLGLGHGMCMAPRIGAKHREDRRTITDWCDEWHLNAGLPQEPDWKTEMPRYTEVVDIECNLLATTEKGILIQVADDKKLWLPKSQVEYEQSATNKSIWIVSMPQWLAEEKELV